MFKNKLFKERLKDTGISIVAALILLIIIAVTGAAFLLTMYGLQKLWGPLDDIVFFGGFGIWGLWHVAKGFKWLFIEPFKTKKQEDLEDVQEEA